MTTNNDELSKKADALSSELCGICNYQSDIRAALIEFGKAVREEDLEMCKSISHDLASYSWNRAVEQVIAVIKRQEIK